MFLTKKELRRRWVRRIVKWTAMAVAVFTVEIVVGLLLCV